MNINQTLISSSNDDDSHRHIDESVHQSAADEVSFTFNHLQNVQTDSNDNPQKLTPDSSPSSGDNDTDQLPDPDDSVHHSATDEVSFTFTNLQIDRSDDSIAKKPVADSSETEVEDSATDEVRFTFTNLQIDRSDDSIAKKLVPESSETDVEDPNEEENVENDYEEENPNEEENVENDYEEEDDGDFTFACVDNNNNYYNNDNDKDFDLRNTEVSEGQIRNVFPLFDQSLLLTSEYNNDGKRRLPIDVPVNNVFIESPPQPRSPSGEPETDGTILSLSEMNTKSNSTGFSKLWRFRDEMNRSNSDGRDAFVFLETPATELKQSTTSKLKRSTESESKSQKVNGGEGKEKGKMKMKDVKEGSKSKKSTPSAHEVYLKKKGGRTEEERRRSYLPYRAGLMGFFTNVNGGLSKNVHPF